MAAATMPRESWHRARRIYGTQHTIRRRALNDRCGFGGTSGLLRCQRWRAGYVRLPNYGRQHATASGQGWGTTRQR
eukprot:367261-Prymnesium_polylepis.1